MKIQLIEKVNPELLNDVKKASNIPIDDENNQDDQEWRKNFITMLDNYNPTVTYNQINNKGRYYGNGLQGCPREIRKFLSNEYYIDIDIVNCHPVILENLLIKHNITVPIFLKEYNKDRDKTITKYKLKDKLDMLKIINNEKCYRKSKNIIEFHKVLYNDLINVLKCSYEVKEKEKNTLGSFMAHCLQDIENQILMNMYNYCINKNIKVGVLVFDGMMIEKETYYPELLNELETNIYKAVGFKIKVIEKSMNTEWKPKNELFEEEYKQFLAEEFNDIVKDLQYNSNQVQSAFSKDTNIKPCDCGYIHYNYMIEKAPLGTYVCCTNRFPPQSVILIPEKYQHIKNYLTITINNNYNNTTINSNHKDTLLNLDENDIQDIYKHNNDQEFNKLIKKLLEIDNDTNLLNIIKYLNYKNGDTYIYAGKIESRNLWYVWNDNKWSKEETPNMNYEYEQFDNELANLSSSSKSKILQNNIKVIRKNIGNIATYNKVTNIWALRYKNDKIEEMIDSNPYLLGFNNGVYDFEAMEFRQQNKDDYVTMSVGYDYNLDGNGKRNEVLHFFETIIPNKDNRHYLLKTLASCLVGINQEERLSIFTGKTRNGKGALTELMKFTLGEYIGVSSGTFIQSDRPDSSAPQPDLLNFRNKRLVILNEVNEKKSLNIQFVKNLVGNDIINCRALHSNKNIEFKAQFKLILNCNERPQLDSNKADIWSKIYLLLFPVTFVDTEEEAIDYLHILKDNKLKAKMKTWKQDMINLLIEYYAIYQNEGLEYTDDIKRTIKQEKRNNDPIQDFIEEYIIKDTGEENQLLVKDVLDKYEQYEGKRMKSIERKKYKELFVAKLGDIYCKSNNSLAYWKDCKFRDH